MRGMTRTMTSKTEMTPARVITSPIVRVGRLYRKPSQRGPRGVIAAHAVDSADGWSRRRTNKQIFDWGGVRADPKRGPCDDLQQIQHTAADIPADVVWVVRLKFCGIHRMTRQDAVAETRSEALDLGFDSVGHVNFRTAWHVTIRPRGLLA